MSDFTIYLDLEDLLQRWQVSPHPSGIQRVLLEVLKALPERAALLPSSPKIVPVRDGGVGRPMVPVSIEDILARRTYRKRYRPRAVLMRGVRQCARKIAGLHRLALGSSHAIERPALRAAALQWRVVRMVFRKFGGPKAGLEFVQATKRRAQDALVRKPSSAAGGGEALASDLPTGRDIFLILGSAWTSEDFVPRVRDIRGRLGVRPVVLVHDLIPYRRPEWCGRLEKRRFQAWLDGTIAQSVAVASVSRASGQDLAAYLAERGVGHLASPEIVPLGHGFSEGTEDHAVAGLPKPRSYALFVSTIEVRKNHALLVRVWARLLRDLPPAQVPDLVFAGGVGFLSADLMQSLENTNYLDGAVRVIRSPSDAEVRALYAGASFTVFPSLFEGWGLPVTESLAFGVPCLASETTSIPEAGGALCRYFDPGNDDDLYAKLVALLNDPDDLERWRQRIAAEFVPNSWTRTADILLGLCERTALQQVG